MPLSLTFDHRTVTGGEASRFLKAVVEDLQKATGQPAVHHGASTFIARLQNLTPPPVVVPALETMQRGQLRSLERDPALTFAETGRDA